MTQPDEFAALNAVMADPQAMESSKEGPKKLSDDDLRGILANEIRQSSGEEDSLIAIEQERADRYYRGDLFGNENLKESRSKVVSRDLAETIDWMMPSLMRSFFYTGQVVKYQDETEEGEAQGVARRISKSVNYLFLQKLRGFMVTHEWIKSALLYKVGVAKFWVEKSREPVKFMEMQLSQQELVVMLEDPSIEVMEMAEMPGGMYDLRAKQVAEVSRVRFECIPPEEFMIARRARTLDDETPFCAHKRKMTRGEIFGMGIPWEDVLEIPTDNDVDYDGRRTTRDEDEETHSFSGVDRKDEASQEVWVWECWIRVDFDGDGFAELRRVLAAGYEANLKILSNEYSECNPMVSWTSNPMPHKFYGMSAYDQVCDLQLIRSTVLRQLLDALYLMNAPRHVALEGSVNLDQLIDSSPGGVVLVEDMDAVRPLEQPQVPSWGLEMLEYLQSVRENRTGVSRVNASTLSDAQNQTAQGVSQVFEAAQARIALIAQIFAETGFQDLFRKVPKVLKASGIGQSKLKVGDEWVDYDPASWPEELTCSVEVGLSPGQTEQRIQRLMLILGLQKEAMATFGPYLTSPQQIYNTAVKITEESGFRNAGQFWTDPQGQPPPPQPPPTEMVELQLTAEKDSAKLKLDAAKVEEKSEYDRKTLEIRERDMILNHEREMARIAMEERVRMHESECRAQSQRETDAKQLEAARLSAAAKPGGTNISVATPEKSGRKVIERDERGLISAVRNEIPASTSRKRIERDGAGKIAAVLEED